MNRHQHKKRAKHEHQRKLKRSFIKRMGLACVTRVRKILGSSEHLSRNEVIVLRKMLRDEREKVSIAKHVYEQTAEDENRVVIDSLR